MKPSLNDVINLSIENRLSNLHTCIPASITKYDAKTQLASVKPSIMRRYSDGTAEELPVVVNCPVVFPSGGGGLLSFPVVQGDKCLLLFCEKSLDVWISNGGIVDPLDRRLFDLSDGIVLMGMFSVPDAGLADADGVVLQDKNGSKVKLNKDKSVEVISAGGAKLNLNKDGKLALGNSTEELLKIIDDILSELLATTTTTSLGPQPFINVANYALLQTRLAAIKGTI